MIGLAMVLVLSGGCGNNQEIAHEFDGRLTVLTSVFPAYALAIRVAGDAADVTNLTSGSADPHDFQLTTRDIRSIQEADLVVTIGLGLEPWLDRILSKKDLRNRPRIALGEKLDGLIESEDAEHIHEHADHSHHHGTINPHVWLDPTKAVEMTRLIEAEFARIDPANAEVYRENANKCITELESLDAEIRDLLAPCADVPFVTLHDAFPYLVERYGLQQVGFIEPNANVEPTPSYVVELSGLIRDRGVRVIFTEPGARSRLLEQLSKDLDLTIATLDPLERGEEADDYFDGLRRNATSLRSALAP